MMRFRATADGSAAGVVLLLVMVWSTPTTAFSGTIERISIASDGTEANGESFDPISSADGRYVAFSSVATNLVPDDTNGVADAFVYDRQAEIIERVSVASGGNEADNWSLVTGISADGRYVVFHSLASNLVPGDTNSTFDVFIHDRQTGTTERVSVASDGAEGNGLSAGQAISDDGRYIAFSSDASNLVPDDTNDEWDVFVRDRDLGTTVRISVAGDGAETNDGSTSPLMSADGRFVMFFSDASNLVPNDTNDERDVFVRDRQTGTTERVSVASDGTEQDDCELLCAQPSGAISADGRFVAFWSDARNLVPHDTNERPDIFVHDRQTGITERVSIASDGTEGNENSSNKISISADGRYVAFPSNASNLVADDTNGAYDVFVHDQETAATQRVSLSSDGIEGNDDSIDPLGISADARFVAFKSSASNLVPNDTNGVADIFVHTRNLTVAPDLLDFGPVLIDHASAPRSLELTNLGVEEATVQEISDPSGPFTPTGGSCDEPPFTLASMESCELELTFSPTMQGPSETMMTITSDDPSSPHTVILRGFGSEEPLHIAPDPLGGSSGIRVG